MTETVFGDLFMCHLGDEVAEADLPTECLQRLWNCKWEPEEIQHIIRTWRDEGEKGITNDHQVARDWLCRASELMLAYTQLNFTGPFSQLADFQQRLRELELDSAYDPLVQLSENGEELNPNVQLGEFLVVAKQILHSLLKQWPEDLYLNWWHLRLVCLQQQALDDLASNLYEQLKAIVERLQSHFSRLADAQQIALLHLEIANGFLLFHRTQKCDEFINALCDTLHVKLHVQGLLGMRTKFQQKALPQLCLQVKQEMQQDLPAAHQTHGSTKLPELLLLEDDTRLERIRFIEPRDDEAMTLPSVLQALVLSKVKQLKRSQPKDRLADEELEPYTQTLIYQKHGPLQVRQSALLLNCVQESTQRRTVERSWKQCEELVKLLSAPTPSVRQRLSYAFAASMEPRWRMQAHLCELLLSLGMTKSALDIYLQIQAWPQVIDCYNRLELRHKAAEVIREQLQVKPTALLHCLLGDATDNPECYKTAWEFSKHTSGKAQAYWGNYHFRRKEYELALPHLQLAVEINALQEPIWLRLGFAAISLERWSLAVHAYITYTHLEPHGFESWNNLAKALIKLGDKQRAHKVLSESLRCNYNNWKVWENFMLVSVDTGHFEDTMNAYLRLSELKERYYDAEVLSITMQALAEGKPDAKGQTPERLLKKARTLMGQQCVKHSNQARVWELAALIAPTALNKAQKLVKAYRAHVAAEFGWASKQPVALKALSICRQLCVETLAAIGKLDTAAGETESLLTSQIHSTRLTVQGCMRAVEKDSSNEWEDVAQLLQEVKPLFEQLVTALQQRTNAAT